MGGSIVHAAWAEAVGCPFPGARTIEDVTTTSTSTSRDDNRYFFRLALVIFLAVSIDLVLSFLTSYTQCTLCSPAQA